MASQRNIPSSCNAISNPGITNDHLNGLTIYQLREMFIPGSKTIFYACLHATIVQSDLDTPPTLEVRNGEYCPEYNHSIPSFPPASRLVEFKKQLRVSNGYLASLKLSLIQAGRNQDHIPCQSLMQTVESYLAVRQEHVDEVMAGEDLALVIDKLNSLYRVVPVGGSTGQEYDRRRRAILVPMYRIQNLAETWETSACSPMELQRALAALRTQIWELYVED